MLCSLRVCAKPSLAANSKSAQICEEMMKCRMGQKWLKSGIFMEKISSKMFIALDIIFSSSYNNIIEIDASIRVC